MDSEKLKLKLISKASTLHSYLIDKVDLLVEEDALDFYLTNLKKLNDIKLENSESLNEVFKARIDLLSNCEELIKNNKLYTASSIVTYIYHDMLIDIKVHSNEK